MIALTVVVLAAGRSVVRRWVLLPLARAQPINLIGKLKHAAETAAIVLDATAAAGW